ncbi:hypothetical protein O6H91_Y341400 [Diphasiastrum complanatum]|nr:hypothetical protein O6H91_Y341400 [Diphasiastrum complanatum]
MLCMTGSETRAGCILQVDLTESDSKITETEDACQLEALDSRLFLSSSQENSHGVFSEDRSASLMYCKSHDGGMLKPDEVSEKMNIWGAQLLNGEVTRVATSAVRGTGLHDLLHVLDNHLKKQSSEVQIE